MDICGDGSRIVVGAWLDDVNGVRSGAAYVFTRSGNELCGDCYGEEVKLVPSDGQTFDYFGCVLCVILCVLAKSGLPAHYRIDRDLYR